MRRPSPLITADARVIDCESSVHETSRGTAGLCTDVEIQNLSDLDHAKIKAALEADKLQLLGRSGQSRFSVNVTANLKELSFQRDLVRFPVILECLGGPIDNFSELIRATLQKKSLAVGPLFAPKENSFLSLGEIQDAKKRGEIVFPENAEFYQNGTVAIPLQDVEYYIPRALIDQELVQAVLTEGKHALNKVQFSRSRTKKYLKAKKDFIGAIQLAFGHYNVVIDEQTSDPAVFHLAARLLHGWRTTGIQIPRQIEIFNKGENDVLFDDLKIHLKFFLCESDNEPRFLYGPNGQKIGEVEKARLIEGGVDIYNALDLGNPQIIHALLRDLDRDIQARILAPQRMIEIKKNEYAGEKELSEILKRTVKRFLMKDDEQLSKIPGISVSQTKSIPHSDALRDVVQGLDYVGGDQTHGKICASNAIPDESTLEALVAMGIGVFIVNNVQDPKNGEAQNPYFSGSLHKMMHRLQKEKGVKFFLRNQDESGKVSVLEFYKNFWMKPETKDRFDRVGMFIAMFGSAKKEVGDILRPEFISFFEGLLNDEELHQVAREEGIDVVDLFGICNGKGPGIMKDATEIAQQNNIMVAGSGMQIVGQKPQTNLDVLVDFEGADGALRQEMLDVLATPKIYNVGGSGTLEEASISLKSAKILSGIVAPHIFIDPQAQEKRHIWNGLSTLLNDFVKRETMPLWLKNVCHMVSSYSEAKDVLKQFIINPLAYWKSCGLSDADIQIMATKAFEIEEKTGIQIPARIRRVLKEKGCLL